MNYEYSYWENKIINNEELWVGNFEKSIITKDSVVIYTGILHEDKDIFQHGWVAYPNIHTALGFIQKVFLPTAMVTWFKEDTEEFLIPIVEFKDLLEDFIYKKNEDENIFYEIKEIYNNLDNISNKEEIKSIINRLNELFNDDPHKKIFIKLFTNLDEIIPFIKNTIGWDELLEEETSLTKDKLEYISEENVLSDIFLNKRLINILNNNMPILF